MYYEKENILERLRCIDAEIDMCGDSMSSERYWSLIGEAEKLNQRLAQIASFEFQENY